MILNMNRYAIYLHYYFTIPELHRISFYFNYNKKLILDMTRNFKYRVPENMKKTKSQENFQYFFKGKQLKVQSKTHNSAHTILHWNQTHNLHMDYGVYRYHNMSVTRNSSTTTSSYTYEFSTSSTSFLMTTNCSSAFSFE